MGMSALRDRGGPARRPLHPGCPSLLALALLLLGTAGAARAQTGRVSIELDKHIAAVGEEVQVTVSIEVEGTAGYSRYIPPAFSEFRVSSGGMARRCSADSSVQRMPRGRLGGRPVPRPHNPARVRLSRQRFGARNPPLSQLPGLGRPVLHAAQRRREAPAPRPAR